MSVHEVLDAIRSVLHSRVGKDVASRLNTQLYMIDMEKEGCRLTSDGQSYSYVLDREAAEPLQTLSIVFFLHYKTPVEVSELAESIRKALDIHTHFKYNSIDFQVITPTSGLALVGYDKLFYGGSIRFDVFFKEIKE